MKQIYGIMQSHQSAQAPGLTPCRENKLHGPQFSHMPAATSIPSIHMIGEGAASRNPVCALNIGRIKIALDTWGLA